MLYGFIVDYSELVELRQVFNHLTMFFLEHESTISEVWLYICCSYIHSSPFRNILFFLHINNFHTSLDLFPRILQLLLQGEVFIYDNAQVFIFIFIWVSPYLSFVLPTSPAFESMYHHSRLLLINNYSIVLSPLFY